MIRQDDKNVVFFFRSEIKKSKVKKAIEELVSKKTKITAYSCDVENAQEIEEVLQQCARKYSLIRDVI